MSNQKEFELVILTGTPEGQNLSFTKPCVSVGRDKGADFFVDDPHSSKTNCLVVLENDEFYVVDDNSTNGTFLNGTQVEKALLKNGDEIRVGETLLQFRCKQEAPAEDGDMTVILPEKGAPVEEVTVILPAEKEAEPSLDEEDTLTGAEESVDPEATIIQPVGAGVDPDATVIQPVGAPKDPNATQLAPPDAAQAQPKGKKKAKAAGSPRQRFGKLDKAARLRIMILVLAIVVLAIFAGAFLIPTGPPAVTNQNAGGQAADAKSGDDAASAGELAGMSNDMKVQKAGQMYELGKARYDERFLKSGSLYEAIQYFEKAETYLADVSPKPPIYQEMEDLTLEAKETLQNQFNSLRLDSYMLIRKRQYPQAREKLNAIVSLIPNPDDERQKFAQDKLKEIRNK
jgi:pSer/pThr/pTyr-binding forkhead associated (FHA) protein